MTTELLNKTKAILNRYNAFPENIDMDTRLKLLSVDANQYEYWGNKYIEGESCAINRAIALEFKHSMVKKPFWIVFFHGAQYSSKEEIFVSSFWNEPDLSDAIYKEDGINENEDADGIEVILDIVGKFDRHWFSEDDSHMEAPLADNNARLVCELAEEIVSIINIDINISIPLEHVSLSTVERLSSELEKAKMAYRHNAGKVLLNELLSNKECPQMLKTFVTKNNIKNIFFEKVVENGDYMPDYGYYIVLRDDRDYDYGFLYECTDCYGDFGSSFEGTEFKHDLHFVEVLKENELLKAESDWTEKDEREALETWDYLLDYSEVGLKKKLF